MKKRNFLLACGFSLIFGLSAAQAAETLKVGATPVPHADILNVVQPMLAKQGVDLKIVEFSDYVQPNLALSDKDLDANFFQHLPYLETFAKDRGLKLKNVLLLVFPTIRPTAEEPFRCLLAMD